MSDSDMKKSGGGNNFEPSSLKKVTVNLPVRSEFTTSKNRTIQYLKPKVWEVSGKGKDGLVVYLDNEKTLAISISKSYLKRMGVELNEVDKGKEKGMDR